MPSFRGHRSGSSIVTTWEPYDQIELQLQQCGSALLPQQPFPFYPSKEWYWYGRLSSAWSLSSSATSSSIGGSVTCCFEYNHSQQAMRGRNRRLTEWRKLNEWVIEQELEVRTTVLWRCWFRRLSEIKVLIIPRLADITSNCELQEWRSIFPWTIALGGSALSK